MLGWLSDIHRDFANRPECQYPLSATYWDAKQKRPISETELLTLTAHTTAHALHDDLTVECRPRVQAFAEELTEVFLEQSRDPLAQEALALEWASDATPSLTRANLN